VSCTVNLSDARPNSFCVENVCSTWRYDFIPSSASVAFDQPLQRSPTKLSKLHASPSGTGPYFIPFSRWSSNRQRDFALDPYRVISSSAGPGLLSLCCSQSWSSRGRCWQEFHDFRRCLETWWFPVDGNYEWPSEQHQLYSLVCG
jgi:hypothetical protein